MGYRHWKTGELLSQDEYHNVPDRRHHYARMHRAKLQKAMLKKLNGEVPIHLGKKVSSVTAVREKGVNVTFEDGEKISADVVIGTDGIKSVRIVLLIQFYLAAYTVIGSKEIICSRSQVELARRCGPSNYA